ncbi:armadillo-type fold protein [Tanacetum coccineum]
MANTDVELEQQLKEDDIRHSDVDVKVAAASCMSEIMRITVAPDAPYDDDQMRDVFQLIVSSFDFALVKGIRLGSVLGLLYKCVLNRESVLATSYKDTTVADLQLLEASLL